MLKKTRSVDCTCEASFYSSKKYSFQKGLRKCCAVLSYEWLVFSTAFIVYALCKELLSSACFTKYQHCRRRHGSFPGYFYSMKKLFICAYKTPEGIAFEPL